ncbi:MAG TPA: hypothetical protein VJM06_01005 [Gaiellaceae bacterium]|nr:hypothetical protein [Gaiellaceae bacterium]
MSAYFASSRFMPCSDCGASVSVAAHDEHVCDPERKLDFLMFQLREEIASFDEVLREYLGSATGRFAQWIAQRDRGSAGS